MQSDTYKRERSLQVTTVTSGLTGQLRQFRAKTRRVWSCRELAEQLEISRDYLKKMLRRNKPFPVRPRVAARLHELMQHPPPGCAIRPHHERQVVVITRYKIPNVVKNLVKPRQCRGHNEYHFMRSATQVYCERRKECMKLWRQKNARLSSQCKHHHDSNRNPVRRRARTHPGIHVKTSRHRAK